MPDALLISAHMKQSKAIPKRSQSLIDNEFAKKIAAMFHPQIVVVVVKNAHEHPPVEVPHYECPSINFSALSKASTTF